MALSCLTLLWNVSLVCSVCSMQKWCSLKWICFVCVCAVCVVYYIYDKQLWFLKQFHFHWAKTWEICACLSMGAKSPPPSPSPSFELCSKQWEACTFTHFTSVHIVIIPFTQNLKCSISITSYAKRPKLYRYLVVGAKKICNLCPWCECAKYMSNNLPSTHFKL